MVLLEKEVNGVTLKTEFVFDGEHIKLVKDVLKCLEGKAVDVNTGGEKNTLTSISILEWFPVVCSKVRLDNSGGSYTTFFNPTIMTLAMKLLLTASRLPPVDIFTGEIKLSRDVINHDDAFCYVLAHEMQHAVNALNFSYPALTNWKGFLLNVIKFEELIKAEDFNPTIDRLMKLDRVQDESTMEEELMNLEDTFGSPVHVWFKGYSEFVNDVIMK